MKALVIGGGGREHAIAWKLAREGVAVTATPGNPGIARIAECIKPASSAPETYLAIAESIRPDFTIAGPEAPLVAGVVDAFRARGLAIVGPTRAAAQLEGSKLFSKKVMLQAGIPTARYTAADSPQQALEALSYFRYPVVVKADGLAAGKGVIIAQSDQEARQAIATLARQVGPRFVIEEFLEGEEVSFIALSDGQRALPLEASQDHKAIYENDQGPNTGGMGAYCDGRILDAHQAAEVMTKVIQPALDHMRFAGTPFTGFLYAGLMMTAHGPSVLEFNVRLGDPEAQALLHRIRGGFADALVQAAHGDVSTAKLDWNPDPSVCVILAASGYPDKPRTGDPITGIDEAEATGAAVFHAGTTHAGGRLVTSGGRVLGVTSSGATLAAAIGNAYRAADHIHFDGCQMRRDIGSKGRKRWGEEATAAGRIKDAGT